jgi:long-chain acyl-CoA synthetase
VHTPVPEDEEATMPNTSPTQQFRTPADEPIDETILTERAPSVGHLFRQRVEADPTGAAYLFTRGEEWVTVTWSEVREQVYRLAAGLIGLGVEPEQRVAIASSTRYEWAVADLATMCAGAATTTIYPTTISEDVAFILADSDSRVAFAEDAEQVDKLRRIRDEIPSVTKVVTFDDVSRVEDDDEWVISLADLDELGAELLATNPTCVDDRIDATTPDRLATIIYTSGTTGRPKGVRLLHDTWSYQGAACQAINILGPDDLQYLWLPLAHVFGKQLLTIPLQIGFATAIDGRVDKIVDNLAVVRPTFMGAAPRIFEKAYARISMMFSQETGVKRRLIDWSLTTASSAQRVREAGGEVGGLLATRLALADRIVLSKVRERFGGRIRFFISGSAALNSDVARWFDAVGLQIAEGYGLTESSSAAFVNRVEAHKVGSVGWAIPGLEATIAEDGEVLLRGPGIMQGYHNNPDATSEVIDDEGWFHTGDIGEIDERGFLTITDRKKDLFKTSNGKYVAPSAIEATFKGLCPYVSQFVVHGDERAFVSALVTLDADAIAVWAEANGLGGRSYEEVVSSPQAHDMVQGYVDELNRGLNRWEQVKKFTILGHDLTVEEGEMTPSLKLRRRYVNEKYRAELDAHYAGS